MFAARVLVFLLCVVGARAKLVKGEVKLSSQNTESYLSKFSFSVGKGFIQGNFTAEGKYFDHFRHDLRVFLFSDVGFAKYKDMLRRGSLCRQRVAEASWSTKIAPERGAESQFFGFDTEVNVVGRTHYWYAVVADCWLEEYNAHPPQFDYSLVFLNENHSHIPADERGLLSVHVAVLLAMAIAGGFCSFKMKQHISGHGIVHLVHLLFAIAFVLQFLSVSCEVWHLRVYQRDGMGLRWVHTWFALDQASSILQTFAELIISFIIVCLGCGWTLSEPLLGSEAGSVSSMSSRPSVVDQVTEVLKSPKYITRRVGPASLFFPCLAGVTIWLEMWGHTYDDDFNQFHDFEHTPGLLAILLRALLCLVFLYGVYQSLSYTPHPALALFLRRFRVLGCVWFLAFPSLVASTFLFPPYMRHQIVTAASLSIQTGVLGIMAFELTTKSEFLRLSSVSQPAEPSGGGGGGAVLAAPPTKKKGKIAMD